MKMKLFNTLFFLCGFSLCEGRVLDNNDFEIWTKATAERCVNYRTHLKAEAEARFGDTASKLYFYYYQVQLDYALSNWVDFSAGYRQFYQRFFPDNEWDTFYAPFTHLKFKLHLKKLEVTNRNLLFYIFSDEAPNNWLYRNRTAIIFPPITRFCLHPLISEEFFILQREGFVQNRIEIGGYFPLRNSGKLSLIYIFRYLDFLGDWRVQHVLRFHLEYTF